MPPWESGWADRLRAGRRNLAVRQVLATVSAVVRAMAGRLVLAIVFGEIAVLLAEQVAGNFAERMGSAPASTPVPKPSAAR